MNIISDDDMRPMDGTPTLLVKAPCALLRVLEIRLEHAVLGLQGLELRLQGGLLLEGLREVVPGPEGVLQVVVDRGSHVRGLGQVAAGAGPGRTGRGEGAAVVQGNVVERVDDVVMHLDEGILVDLQTTKGGRQ